MFGQGMADYIKELMDDNRRLRTAAQQVCDECSADMPPSNGAIEALREALLAGKVPVPTE